MGRRITIRGLVNLLKSVYRIHLHLPKDLERLLTIHPTSRRRLTLPLLLMVLVLVALLISLKQGASPSVPSQPVTSPTPVVEAIPTILATPSQQSHQRTAVRSLGRSCGKPTSLTIGQIDEQFNIDPETLRSAVEAAANEWNTATGELLFVVQDNADVTVNLLFDGRQDSINQLAAEEREISALSEALKARIQQHDAAVRDIESAAATWNRETELHNKRVEIMNARSATPVESSDDLAALQAEREDITATSARLHEAQHNLILERDRVNQDATLLKQEGEALNARIRSVQERFPPSVVTEGEHRRGPSVNEINIYTFHNLKEFNVVLLHELGHALGLPHTDEKPTIMHPLIEHGSGPYHLTSLDVQAALNLCGR